MVPRELPSSIERFLERLGQEQYWLLSPDFMDEDLGWMLWRSAGRQGKVSWWAQADPTPSVVVHDEDVLLQAVVAQEPLGWTQSFTKLDRLLNGRMVRFPAAHITDHFAETLPAAALLKALPEDWVAAGTDTWWADGGSWQLVSNSELHADEWLGGPTTITLGQYAELPFSEQLIADAVDAADIGPAWAASRPEGPPPDRMLMEDEDDQGRPYWLLRDSGLASALRVSNAIKAERLVKRALRKRDPDLATRIELDSEAAEFFAYAQQESDVQRLSALLNDLMAERKQP